jgi:arylsulfatase A-like enzyme/Flp pilus assembly protein TadD
MAEVKDVLKNASVRIIVILLSALAAATLSAGEKNGQNLLLVTIDTLRPDRLGCYRSIHLQTPAIDQVAARGVIFTRAFAHTPLTLPSHANILLGALPVHHGIHDNGFFVVGEEFLTLAEHLKANGYATGAFVGAFPLDSRFGLTQGFDVYDDNYGTQPAYEFTFLERKADAVVASALGWLEKQTAPWFLWVHLFDPHQPYEPPAPYDDRYKDDLYSGEVAYTDAALAKLFAYLNETGQGDKTVTVVTGDHGQSLGEHGESTHGYFAYNSTLWVPLIISGPGVKAGRVDQDVCHIDIFPTLCDLLGLSRPPSLQGLSLVPAMDGQRLGPRAIYFESLYPYYRRGWAPLRGLIEGGTKFIETPVPELYDLAQDFAEANNLAPARAAEVERGKARLARLMKNAEAPSGQAARPTLSVEAQEKLKSLGYIGGPQAPARKEFSARDDLKTLLPVNKKFEAALELYQKGESQRCMAELRQVIEERPDFDNGYIYLAALLGKQGQVRESVAVLEKGYRLNPTSYRIASDYGIGLVEEGRFDDAVAVLQGGLKLVDYDPETWNFLGVAYWNKGDLEKALEAYNRAYALDRNYTLVLNNLGAVYLTLFQKDRKRQDFQAAMEFFKKAIEYDPRYAPAYNGLGSAYRVAGAIDEAIICWEQALEIDPRHRFSLFNLGLAYLDKGEKAKALSSLERYKTLYGPSLSPREKAEVEALIAKCR